MSGTGNWQAHWDRLATEHSEDRVAASGRSTGSFDLTSECVRIRRLLELGPDDRVLDVCCGNGIIAQGLAGSVKAWHGCDISLRMLKSAVIMHIPHTSFVWAGSTTLPFKDARFTKVLLNGCLQLHSLAQALNAVAEAKRTCLPGGLILIGDIPDIDRKHAYDVATGFGTYRKLLGLASRSKRRILGQPILKETWYQRDWVLDSFSDRIHDVVLHDRHPPFRFDALIRKG